MNNYSRPGVIRPTVKSCAEATQIMLGRKPPKRKVVRPTGMKYKRDEDKLRPLVMKILRQRGFIVARIEPSTRGKFGLGDLHVDKESIGLMGWVEVKTPDGKLSDGQLDFQRRCQKCGTPYEVVRSVEEAKQVFNERNYNE